MKEQKMTISGLYRPGWHAFAELGQVPLLQLAGQWLAEAGLPVGTKVRVEVVEDSRGLITRVEAWKEERRACGEALIEGEPEPHDNYLDTARPWGRRRCSQEPR